MDGGPFSPSILPSLFYSGQLLDSVLSFFSSIDSAGYGNNPITGDIAAFNIQGFGMAKVNNPYTLKFIVKVGFCKVLLILTFLHYGIFMKQKDNSS